MGIQRQSMDEEDDGEGERSSRRKIKSIEDREGNEEETSSDDSGKNDEGKNNSGRDKTLGADTETTEKTDRKETILLQSVQNIFTQTN